MQLSAQDISKEIRRYPNFYVPNCKKSEVTRQWFQTQIEFGFALENRELEKCIEILEKQESKDQEGNWATLANLALEEFN